jgi:branched-chain amino acid transport system permease protein
VRLTPRRIAVAFCGAASFWLVAASGASAQETTSTSVPTRPTGAAITGVLTVDDAPVPGVRITVEQDGTEIGTATSDADGRWRIAVARPGAYRVALDPETLPEGVTAARPELPRFRVFGSTAQTARFALASGETRGPETVSRFEELLNLFVSGIRFGLIIGLCSVGLSLIYGTTGLVNFAHGELVTFGALAAWFFNTNVGGPEVTLIAAAVLGVMASGVLGAGLELGVFRPMVKRRSGATARMLVSIGLALVLRYLYQVIFLGSPRAFREYSVQSPIDFGPIDLPPRDYVVMAIAFVVLIAVGVVLQKTRMGTAIRAVSDERDLAAASGIDVGRVILMVWVGGAALAGLGGILLALSQSVQWNLGFRLLLTMFAAIVLGGLGNAYGAMVGGLVVGIASQVSTFWLPSDFQFAVALIILILVLLVRPQGILGVRERVG